MSQNVISMNGLLECEYFDIHSSIVNDDFRIFVAKPPFATTAEFPVIYVADGNTLFSQVVGIQRTLAWGSEASPAFIVGIGYPTETGFMQAVSKRNRDYAPTRDDSYAQEVLHSAYAAGAEAFLSFLTDELKPALAQRYPIISLTDSTFVGASLAALFGAWVLLRAPKHFRNYILSSPALWWNHEEPREWERRYADEHTDLDASVFLSAGELEHPAAHRAHAALLIEKNPMLRAQVEAVSRWHDAHGWPDTAELTNDLARRLSQRQYPSLRIACHNMPEETHMSVAPSAITRGLRYVGEQWQPW
jgi:predicted alpha/beta superfamily hydrolase